VALFATPQQVYTEGVRQFQPRVELWQPWDHECHLVGTRNPERVGARRAQKQSLVLSPGLPKLNPGLKLANTFGVTLRESEFSHNLFQPYGVSTSTLETRWNRGRN